MRRGLTVLLMGACCASAQAESRWSALWQTPDQRGEAELRAGDAAAAARTFTDPRRKAHAQSKAGDDRGAAETYAGLDDADAHYNRGNALARAGDLRQALQAYDAALARNPQDRDAQRNRDRVAQALRSEPSPGGPGRQPAPQAGGAGNPPPAQQQAASGPPGDKQAGRGSSAGPGREPSAPVGDSPAAPLRQAASGEGGSAVPRPSGAPEAKDPDLVQRADPVKADDAAQAQRDVTGAARPPSGSRDRRTAPPAPRSEQQLAEDQWLRRLPDDPGGLLRRKFLIQHLIRQGTPP